VRYNVIISIINQTMGEEVALSAEFGDYNDRIAVAAERIGTSLMAYHEISIQTALIFERIIRDHDINEIFSDALTREAVARSLMERYVETTTTGSNFPHEALMQLFMIHDYLQLEAFREHHLYRISTADSTVRQSHKDNFLYRYTAAHVVSMMCVLFAKEHLTDSGYNDEILSRNLEITQVIKRAEFFIFNNLEHSLDYFTAIDTYYRGLVLNICGRIAEQGIRPVNLIALSLKLYD